MNIDLKGRKAIVTGSTAGIGRAVAEGLARAGAAVVINGRGEQRVATALAEIRELFPKSDLTGVAADLETAEGAGALFAQAPDADILVNNVGTARPKPFFDLADDDWLSLFQLNVMSGVRAARHYVPKMMARGWGRVVFISSESALNVPKEMIDYGMTKTAQLVRGHRNSKVRLRSSPARPHVSVSRPPAIRGRGRACLSPDPTRTPGLVNLAGQDEANQKGLLDDLVTQLSVGRVDEPRRDRQSGCLPCI